MRVRKLLRLEIRPAQAKSASPLKRKMISPEVELSKKAGSRSSSFEYSLFFRDIVSLPPTQVLAYAERKLSSPCTVVKETIRTGIYQGEDMSLPTTTTSVYGFRNRAIAASSEPMGMVIRTDRSAGSQIGRTNGHMRR